MRTGALLVLVCAVALGTVLWLFSFSPLALVLHTATAVHLHHGRSTPTGPGSLEAQALHSAMRATPVASPQSVAQMRHALKDFPALLTQRTPWGGGGSVPATAAASTATRLSCSGVPVLAVAWPGGRRLHTHAVLYLHGGGYVAGSADQAVPFLERLSRRTGSTVFSVDYRLAPEHPVAGGARADAAAVFEWLLATKGLAPENIIVAGDSAGGGLSALLLQHLANSGRPLPGGAVLISPFVDASLATSAKSMAETKKLDVMLKGDEALWIVPVLAASGGSNKDPKSPEISPIYGRLHGLPPLLVLVSRTETLRDDAVVLVDKVRSAGGTATLYMPEADLPHIWPVLNLPESVEDTAIIAHWMNGRWDAVEKEVAASKVEVEED